MLHDNMKRRGIGRFSASLGFDLTSAPGRAFINAHHDAVLAAYAQSGLHPQSARTAHLSYSIVRTDTPANSVNFRNECTSSGLRMTVLLQLTQRTRAHVAGRNYLRAQSGIDRIAITAGFMSAL